MTPPPNQVSGVTPRNVRSIRDTRPVRLLDIFATKNDIIYVVRPSCRVPVETVFVSRARVIRSQIIWPLP